MTTGWIVVNILLSAGVSAIVAGASILVPLRLDREMRRETSLSGHWVAAVAPVREPAAAFMLTAESQAVLSA
jgi:hypothetical protein